MKNPSVAVLMSTYNGEKYLKEQIDSILAQKGVDITLYIRDDGSSDKTENIIKTYIGTGNVFYFKDGNNLRSGLSFMRLLYKVVRTEKSFDYYAFADQDDIWLEDKLIAAINIINNYNEPVLYGSNQIIYRDGIREGVRYPEPPDLTFMGHITANTVSGCTMVMNRQLAEIIVSLKCPNKEFLTVRCHDSWVYLVACVVGRVVYDDNAYILYRIHSNNVVGIRTLNIKQKIQKFFKGTTKNMRMKSSMYILNAFPDKQYKEKKYIEEMAYYQRNFLAKISLLKDYKICKSGNEGILTFFIKVLINYI